MGSQAYVIEDLISLPDDGRRHELIDGSLIVTPVPDLRHQKIVGQLLYRLHDACPPDLWPLTYVAVRSGRDTELRPDVVVGREADFTEEALVGAPVLVAEVLSPHTVLLDLHTKKAVCERLRVPSYWVVDPLDLTLTVFELAGSRYELVAEVKGDDVFESVRPFPVRFTPASLLNQQR